MFGYVTVYKPELKMKDYYKYRAYYCGLCHELKKKYGPLGQMTLTYDMTFLIILLTSLYESKTEHKKEHCLIHPVKKHDRLKSEITEYAADMNIILSYYHLMDDWKDEKSPVGLVGMAALKKAYLKTKEKYPRQSKVIKQCLSKLHNLEKSNIQNIDQVSRCFGELMAELLIFRKDQWEEPLRRVGFFLGKFIYLIDAYEDLEEDLKNNNYNPLKTLSKKDTYEKYCNEMLTMMMTECASAFETLPCLIDIDILRNIIYVGVWTKYDAIQKERNSKREEQDNDSRSI